MAKKPERRPIDPLVEGLLELPPQDPDRLKNCKMISFTKPMEFFSQDFDPLAVDMFVDAKDSVNNWCVAQVRKVKHDVKSVKLSFEGWSSKYDTEVKRGSMKIAPFRVHTFGYTGQQKAAFREFKIHHPYMVQLEQRLNLIYESNFCCFNTGFECT